MLLIWSDVETSPTPISGTLPPHPYTQSVLSVTIRVWPSGWQCQIVRLQA